MSSRIRWGTTQSVRRSANLHHQIAGHIGTLIGAGHLAPGAILPNEASLGSKFGVSRTVLREAMKVLASKRLVEVRRKTGTRVRQRAEWNLFDPEVLSWSFAGEGVPTGLSDLLEVRMVIEPAAAGLAAERAQPIDLSRIENAYRAMAATANDPPSSIRPDLQFHLGVLAASHNAFMSSFGTLIQTALCASFRFTSTDANAVGYKRTLVLHKKVLGAIRLRHPKKAEAAMAVLLRVTLQDIEKKLRSGRPRRP